MSSVYYRGAPSDHFDGLRFSNLYAPTIDRSPREVWRWKRQRSAALWPPPTPTIATDHPPPRVPGLRIAMVGHATLLIQVANTNILLDPIWSDRASPLSFLGPRRQQPPGIAFDHLPPIDVVLLTHSHYDHMDIPTLRRLQQRDRPRLIAPLGNDAVLRRADKTLLADTGDWWDRIALTPAITLDFCPANHWSSRWLTDRRRALWCGYVLQTPAGTLYLAGDTAYGNGRLFTQIRRRYGRPTLAVLPIGAYEPRWFMANQHMNPDDAVRAMLDCGAEQALGVHWGTFQLTDEPQQAPIEALAAARAAHAIPTSKFIALHPGAVWTPIP